MVIEVSKEVDIVRIGIDRYSLKTGLKLKTVMDVSTRVVKEPRGFIRIIQCLLAILAFATTVAFSTTCSFEVCRDEEDNETIDYEIEYPFVMKNNLISVPKDCKEDSEHRDLNLAYDFSNSAEFFVATGVISFLYTILILIVYIFCHQAYANNPKIPAIDLVMTAILTTFWLGGSSAWAQGVADLKYYLHPDNIFGYINACDDDKCETESDGSYATLNVSLVFGFANFLLWLSSLWFVYKETVFHTPLETAPQDQNQTPKVVVGRV